MSKEGLSGVSLEECGFFISKSHGFLGASPDRIIHLPTQSDPGYQLCHQMFSTTYKWGYFMACGTNKAFFMQHIIMKETSGIQSF